MQLVSILQKVKCILRDEMIRRQIKKKLLPSSSYVWIENGFGGGKVGGIKQPDYGSIVQIFSLFGDPSHFFWKHGYL